MPRASYGDKFTVTVMKGEEKHTVFDLTSKVVDFKVLSGADGSPATLLVLAEEEFVAVDLTTGDNNWPVYNMPYLNPIHASSITCITHVANVNKSVYDRILAASEKSKGKNTSTKPWPIDGGSASEPEVDNARDVLITGHEDGSVKFWACSGVSLYLLTSLRTNKFFIGDDLDEPRDEDEEEESLDEEWPPFKKLGAFDPYSDDPRLAVKKVAFCGVTGKLFVGGTAGQVLLCDLCDEDSDKKEVDVIKSDLVTEKEGFTWKGHSALVIKAVPVKIAAGFQPNSIMQVTPPASINSLAFAKDYGLLAAGTAHGLVIVDTVQQVVVTSKCTLNAQGMALGLFTFSIVLFIFLSIQTLPMPTIIQCREESP